MSNVLQTPTVPRLVLARELSRFQYDDPAARRAVPRGELVRILRGIYADAAEWHAATPGERYLAMCRGYAASRAEPPVLSHESAAAVWGLPLLGSPPHVVHVATDERRHGRRASRVRAHLLRLSEDELAWRDGVLVTSLARTVVDLAASAGVFTAVAAIDHVLHIDRFGRSRTELSRDALVDALDTAAGLRGAERARVRIAFGETGAATIAESASRVTMAHIGAPPPVLQRRYLCESGEYDTDFYFEEADAIGEVDGKQKYLDPALRGGRSASEVVYDEKVREDELRMRCRAFGRWSFADALRPDLLRPRLVAMGVPVGRPRPRLP